MIKPWDVRLCKVDGRWQIVEVVSFPWDGKVNVRLTPGDPCSMVAMNIECFKRVVRPVSNDADGALLHFIEAIESVGGLVRDHGVLVPVGDPSWPFLARAYESACTALGITPLVHDE